MLKIAYSPIYKYELPDGHRFPMIKYELLPEQLLYEGAVTQDNFFSPGRLSDAEITLTHTQEFLDKLMSLNLSRKEQRAIGFPIRKELIERGRFISHGTYECALFALENKIAMNIAGGTHHSFADRGEGFCIFNDFAIATNLLFERNQLSKVLIIDLDVHQGNGTAHIFRKDERVFTFSMHGEKNYPVRKEKSDLDIGLPDGCKDELYLDTLEQYLDPLIHDVRPDFIFYLAGVDILATDKLGRLAVSIEACKKRDELVFKVCSKYEIPVAVSMGGGYSEDIRDIIEAHANTFRVAQNIFY